MKIKQLLAGGLAALTLGITLGATASFVLSQNSLGDFVAVSGDRVTSPLIVYGDEAPTLDIIGGTDLAAGAAGFATRSVAVPGAAVAGVTGGVTLATPSQNLFTGSALNAAKDSLGAVDAPTILPDGNFIDDGGTEFDYEQFVRLGARTIKWSDSGGTLDDPALIVDLGTVETTDPYMKLQLTFIDEISLDEAQNDGNTLTIFGSTFNWHPDSDTNGSGNRGQLVLAGGGTEVLLEEAAPVTINVDGVDHIVELKSTESATSGNFCIDGSCRSVSEDKTSALNGVEFFVKDVFHTTRDGSLSSASVVVGTRKLTLRDNSAVLLGADLTAIDNTIVSLSVNINSTSKSKLTSATINVSAKDTNVDHLLGGTCIPEPVFGSLKICFNGVSPDIGDTSRTAVEVFDRGSDEAVVKFTDKKGRLKEFVFGFDSATATDGTAIRLANNNANLIHVLEGAVIRDDDYFILSIGDFDKLDMYRLFKVTSLSSVGSASAKIALEDVLSASSLDIELGSDGFQQRTIDGFDFFFNLSANNAESFTVNWGGGAAALNPGGRTTIWPLIGLEGGNTMAIIGNGTNVTNVSLTNTRGLAHVFEVPTGLINISAINGTSITLNDITTQTPSSAPRTITLQDFPGNASGIIQAGQQQYNVSWWGPGQNITTWVLAHTGQGIQASNPAILIIEGENDDNRFNTISIPVGDTTKGIEVEGTRINNTDGLCDTTAELQTESNSDFRSCVTTWGSHIRLNTDEEDTIVVKVPPFQAVANIAIGQDPQFGTTVGGASVQQAVRITSPIARTDREVSLSALTSDLILIGGPCANDLVAQLLGPTEQCDNWPYSTGIIKSVNVPQSAGRKALIVAGTLATDTRALAARALSGTLAFQQ